MSLSLESTSLNNIMLECQAMIEPQARKSGISMSFPQMEQTCFVNADRTRVTQVLINLLSNAIKHNRAQGAVQVTCNPQGSQRIRISVHDTGEGLTPEQRQQLFQPFNRLGREAGAEEGTGIGLVMSKRLVELMEGEIGAESSLGGGSMFWFELNLAAPPEQTIATIATIDPSAPHHAQHLHDVAPRTLQQVEDNLANLQLVEQPIERRPDLRLVSATESRKVWTRVFSGILPSRSTWSSSWKHWMRHWSLLKPFRIEKRAQGPCDGES